MTRIATTRTARWLRRLHSLLQRVAPFLSWLR